MLSHLLLALAQSSERPALPDAAALSNRLRALEAAHPAHVRRVEYGRSARGAPLELVRIAREPVDPSRPGLLVVAGLDAEHPFEPWLAAELAEGVATGAGPGGDANALLDAYTVYVLPLADPDGLALAVDGSPGGHGPDEDDDRDGRVGEDPPIDVNGDGQITWLRRLDPEGAWIEDAHDRRALIERASLVERLAEEPRFAPRLGPEVARWTRMTEGRDADGDERTGEDPAGDRRFDANFPAGWPEHEPRAGRYPTGDPAVRALCDWVLEHEELSVVLALGAVDHVGRERKAAGSGQGRVPGTGPTEDDLPWLSALAERAREATGIEVGKGDVHDDRGHFVRWAYDHRGLWTLGLRPWGLPKAADTEEPDTEEPENQATDAEEPAPEADAESGADAPSGGERPSAEGADESPDGPAGDPSDDAGRLAWIDQQGESWRFAEWTDFDHPELGPVQIGGFAPGAHTIPPVDEWTAIADGVEAFLFGLADTSPRLVIERCTAEALDDGLWKIEVRAVNRGWLPSSSEARDRSRQGRPAAVTLDLPDGATLLSGSARVTLPGLDGGDGATVEWLVRANDASAASVSLTSPQAGIDSATPSIEEAR